MNTKERKHRATSIALRTARSTCYATLTGLLTRSRPPASVGLTLFVRWLYGTSVAATATPNTSSVPS
jgi:hypothetical protein